MNSFQVLEKRIKTGSNPLESAGKILVIAEVGINHNGNVELAKNLIKEAKDAGCDAVKFQKRTIEIVYSEEELSASRDSPWGKTQRDQKEGLEFSHAQYGEIDEYCRSLDIQWSASAWDIPSLRFMEEFNPSFHKVASALLTHQDFLTEIATLGRLTFVSTGMASFNDIDKAVEIFSSHKTPIVLMHTVSTYPTPEVDLNLSAIPAMRKRYGLNVGYSGHEASVSPSLVAAALGAIVIERHITLDRSMYGSDQAASLEPNGLRQLVSTVSKVPMMLGTGLKDWAPGEQVVAKKLRYWEQESLS
jgi:N-acetylneuraminate synthase